MTITAHKIIERIKHLDETMYWDGFRLISSETSRILEQVYQHEDRYSVGQHEHDTRQFLTLEAAQEYAQAI